MRRKKSSSSENKVIIKKEALFGRKYSHFQFFHSADLRILSELIDSVGIFLELSVHRQNVRIHLRFSLERFDSERISNEKTTQSNPVMNSGGVSDRNISPHRYEISIHFTDFNRQILIEFLAFMKRSEYLHLQMLESKWSSTINRTPDLTDKSRESVLSEQL